MRRLVVIAAVALAIPALAIAAPKGRYNGKIVDDSGKVTFKVENHKVKAFAVDGVGATCPSGFTVMTVYVPSAKIRDGGTFSKRYRPVKGIDQRIRLKGSFDGRKAAGTVKGGPLCTYNEKWTAELKR